MIIPNVPLQVVQSRDILPDPLHPPFAGGDWGAPPAMVPSKVVRCVVHVDVCYTSEHDKLIHDLLEATQKIGAVVAADPLICPHATWDFINKCVDVRCGFCGNVEPFSDKHKLHRPFKVCNDPNCRQCELIED